MVHVLQEDAAHGLLVHGWVVFDVGIYHEGCELSVLAVLDLVFEDAEDVETGKDSISKVNIIHKRLLAIISPLHWISSSNNGAAGLQSCNNACLRYGNTLLFHGLMNRCPVLLIHLVELIDQADPLISEHHCSSLKGPFPGAGVSVHTGS